MAASDELEHKPAQELQVLHTQILEVQRNLPSMLASTVLAGLAIVYYFSPSMHDQRVLLYWLAALVAVSVLRLACRHLWHRDPRACHHARSWALATQVLAALTGGIWSLMATALLPSIEGGFQAAVAVLLMGVSAAVVVSLVVLYRAYASFLLCMLAPAVHAFAKLPGEANGVIAIMLAFFLVLLLVGGWRSAGAAERAIRLSLDLRDSVAAEEAARRAAERANASKDVFLMNMSHELRTPMHAVLAYAELGASRSSEDKIKGYLQRIQASAKSLLALLGDLLDLASLEMGRIKLLPVPTQLKPLLEAMASEVQPDIGPRAIRLELCVPDELPDVMVDSARFSQVIRNVLDNAIKFSPAGETISIVASHEPARPDGLAITIAVIDRGLGIPAGELESVFDKFTQSSKTRTGAGGTGLGLAICREIVTAHGGRIHARHNEGDGSTIVIELPTAAAGIKTAA